MERFCTKVLIGDQNANLSGRINPVQYSRVGCTQYPNPCASSLVVSRTVGSHRYNLHERGSDTIKGCCTIQLNHQSELRQRVG
jgi:hypothetical protein